MVQEKVFTNATTAKYDALRFAASKGHGAFVDGPVLRPVTRQDGKTIKTIVYVAYYT